MKAFLVSVVVTVVVAVAAALILGSLDLRSADVYQSKHGTVRL